MYSNYGLRSLALGLMAAGNDTAIELLKTLPILHPKKSQLETGMYVIDCARYIGIVNHDCITWLDGYKSKSILLSDYNDRLHHKEDHMYCILAACYAISYNMAHETLTSIISSKPKLCDILEVDMGEVFTFRGRVYMLAYCSNETGHGLMREKYDDPNGGVWEFTTFPPAIIEHSEEIRKVQR